jgi:hypothetical protein
VDHQPPCGTCIRSRCGGSGSAAALVAPGEYAAPDRQGLGDERRRPAEAAGCPLSWIAARPGSSPATNQAATRATDTRRDGCRAPLAASGDRPFFTHANEPDPTGG